MSKIDNEPDAPGQNEQVELTLISKIGWALSGAAIFLLFLSFSESDRGTVAAGSFACIAALVRVKWDLRGFGWFWAFISAATLIHIFGAIAFSGEINFHPTILILPLFLVDFGVLVFLLVLLERKMKPT